MSEAWKTFDGGDLTQEQLQWSLSIQIAGLRIRYRQATELGLGDAAHHVSVAMVRLDEALKLIGGEL